MSDVDEIDRELLAEGLADYVGLWEHVSAVRGPQPAAGDDAVRAAVMDRVTRMLDAGYVAAGGLLDDCGFEPWDTPAGEAVERIASEWSDLGREPTVGDIVWFQNTAGGDALARSLAT